MTFEMLAKKVADEYREGMVEEGYNTFAEMMNGQGWDWDDLAEVTADLIEKITDGECWLTAGDFSGKHKVVVVEGVESAWGNFIALLLHEFR